MQNSFCDEISKRPSIWVERTTITKSATAAAGSGDLHAYRRFKRAETLRQREEEEINLEKLDHDEFQKTRSDKYMKSLELTVKKHIKRQQLKEKLKMKKEQQKLEKEAAKINQFANDGSFLQKYQQQSPEVEQVEQANNSDQEQ